MSLARLGCLSYLNLGVAGRRTESRYFFEFFIVVIIEIISLFVMIYIIAIIVTIGVVFEGMC